MDELEDKLQEIKERGERIEKIKAEILELYKDCKEVIVEEIKNDCVTISIPKPLPTDMEPIFNNLAGYTELHEKQVKAVVKQELDDQLIIAIIFN